MKIYDSIADKGCTQTQAAIKALEDKCGYMIFNDVLYKLTVTWTRAGELKRFPIEDETQ